MTGGSAAPDARLLFPFSCPDSGSRCVFAPGLFVAVGCSPGSTSSGPWTLTAVALPPSTERGVALLFVLAAWRCIRQCPEARRVPLAAEDGGNLCCFEMPSAVDEHK